MEELNKWMAAKGLSQSDVARMLGVSRQAVQSWTIGRVTPGLYYAMAVEALSDSEVPATCWLTKKEQLSLEALSHIEPGGGDD